MGCHGTSQVCSFGDAAGCGWVVGKRFIAGEKQYVFEEVEDGQLPICCRALMLGPTVLQAGDRHYLLLHYKRW